MSKLDNVEFDYVGARGSKTYKVEGCYATFVPGVFAEFGVTTYPWDKELLEELVLSGAEADAYTAVRIIGFTADRQHVEFLEIVEGHGNHGVWSKGAGMLPDEWIIVNGVLTNGK